MLSLNLGAVADSPVSDAVPATAQESQEVAPNTRYGIRTRGKVGISIRVILLRIRSPNLDRDIDGQDSCAIFASVCLLVNSITGWHTDE